MEFKVGTGLDFDENRKECDEYEECKTTYEAWVAAGKPEVEGTVVEEDDYDEDGDDMEYDESDDEDDEDDEDDDDNEWEDAMVPIIIPDKSLYRVGDRVVIRTDLVGRYGVPVGNDTFVPDMEKYRGKTLTILEVDDSRTKYRMLGVPFNWTDEMIREATLALAGPSSEELSGPRYKPGDKVVVRKDLEAHKDYGEGVAVSEMVERAGQTVTISRITFHGAKYNIVEDIWNWTDEMFDHEATYALLPQIP